MKHNKKGSALGALLAIAAMSGKQGNGCQHPLHHLANLLGGGEHDDLPGGQEFKQYVLLTKEQGVKLARDKAAKLIDIHNRIIKKDKTAGEDAMNTGLHPFQFMAMVHQAQEMAAKSDDEVWAMVTKGEKLGPNSELLADFSYGDIGEILSGCNSVLTRNNATFRMEMAPDAKQIHVTISRPGLPTLEAIHADNLAIATEDVFMQLINEENARLGIN